MTDYSNFRNVILNLVLINFIQLHAAATVKKIAIFTYPDLHFLFALGRPVGITQNVAWMKRQFRACQTHRSMYPSIFNSFPVIQTASAKNRRFHVPQPTFFVSPGDAPGAITLNVVWMEREFDAYKLSRCMGPSICHAPDCQELT